MTQIFASYARDIGNIDLSCWGGIGVVLSLLMFQITLLFLLLPSFSGKDFSALGTVRRVRFLSPRLRFFLSGVFHMAALALSGGEIGWPGTLRTILVYFTSSEARTECRLGLNINCFLYCVFKAV